MRLLLQKAAQDEYVLDRLLADPGGPVEPFGFHAQQAAEKLLKATIKAAGVEYPLSHQVAELLDIARDAGAPVPIEFEDLKHLSPFAVQFRYDALPVIGAADLDPLSVRRLVADLRSWVEQFVAERGVDTTTGDD